MNSGLEGLKIYQLACELEKEVYELVKTFPVEEKFRKVDQLLRSSSSICDNISEGYGKHSYQSKIQSFYVARGEAEEVRSQLIRAGNLGLINTKSSDELSDKTTNLIKGINGYIRFLRGEKNSKTTEVKTQS